jgi:AcrR family transcriptional regulator
VVAVKPRAYRSELRAAQARETRRRVVDAARELFATQGYATTTIAAIATAAEVSPDTIYAVFGSKKALLKAIVDIGAGGDDEDIAVLERRDPQAMRNETDQRRQLEMFAAGVTEQLERLRPIDDILRSAASVDEAAAQLRGDVQLRQRREAMRTVAGWVAERGPLREGTSTEDAAAILWTLASPEVHRMFRENSGWSPDKYRAWLASALIQSLLP